ncbi:hypothetical protein SVIOM342S_03447 [Streptomyces violaceorubidus]
MKTEARLIVLFIPFIPLTGRTGRGAVVPECPVFSSFSRSQRPSASRTRESSSARQSARWSTTSSISSRRREPPLRPHFSSTWRHPACRTRARPAGPVPRRAGQGGPSRPRPAPRGPAPPQYVTSLARDPRTCPRCRRRHRRRGWSAPRRGGPDLPSSWLRTPPSRQGPSGQGRHGREAPGIVHLPEEDRADRCRLPRNCHVHLGQEPTRRQCQRVEQRCSPSVVCVRQAAHRHRASHRVPRWPAEGSPATPKQRSPSRVLLSVHGEARPTWCSSSMSFSRSVMVCSVQPGERLSGASCAPARRCTC